MGKRKSILYLIVAVVYLAVLAGPALAAEYRVFTAKDGRETTAKIVKANARYGKVTLERENGVQVTVPGNVFSEKDQAYIKDWLMAEQFFMNFKFKISVDKDKTGGEDDNTERLVYTISLDNRMNMSILDARVEYCMCIKTSGFNGHDDSTRTVKGSIDCGVLEQGTKNKFVTKPALLKITEMPYSYTETVDRGGGYTQTISKTGYKKATEDKIAGIMLKIYGPVVGGEQVVRNYAYPSDLNEDFRW